MRSSDAIGKSTLLLQLSRAVAFTSYLLTSCTGAIDASNIPKPALARGGLQAIGATTLDEYRKHVEKDAALERRFQPIMVHEPTADQAVQILRGLRDRYEVHHWTEITDKAIETAGRLSDRYDSDRFLPEKAVDLIDEAASRVRLRSYVAPPDLKKLEGQLEEVRKEKEAAVQGQEFEKRPPACATGSRS